MYKFLFLCLALVGSLHASFVQEWADVPTSYNGRFRPIEATSRLWLYDLSHKQSLKKTSSFEVLWDLHFNGIKHWENTPLFWIQSASTKKTLQLPLKQNRFSYHTVRERLNTIPNKTTELNHLANQLNKFEDHENNFLVLPSRYKPGVWFPLKKLKSSDSNNFTAYNDNLFHQIKSLYLQLEQAVNNNDSSQIEPLSTSLAKSLKAGYASLAGKTYQSAYGKALSYPSFTQLKIERLYYTYPWISFCIALYLFGFISFLFFYCFDKPQFKTIALCLTGLAFSLHTLILGARCYILARPPVSNMFETMIYVPWIAIGAGFIIQAALKNTFVLVASCLAAIPLLIFLQLSNFSSSMENVQAVLDSQYWLIVHVLMVVGSYGLFFLCGILGHVYLALFSYYGVETAFVKNLAKAILQCMYIGVALLIPGTILGGVWAAQSWGRFWDWDPKESWAFISACIYLVWIHAYRFRYIDNFGLAVGSVVGLLSIIFTWYGVNYILGTGLHSYGFGSGGEKLYYLFLTGEFVFLAVTCFRKFKTRLNA